MAYISHNLKTIYIRVPKTGSTSTVNAFAEAAGDMKEIGEAHVDAVGARFLCPEWATYRKIGFIRHPLTWIRSFARQLSHAPKHGDMLTMKLHSDSIGFLREAPTPFSWLCHPVTGEVMVDEVWRMEDMDKLFAEWGVAPRHKHKSTHQKRASLKETPEFYAALDEHFDREFLYYSTEGLPNAS